MPRVTPGGRSIHRLDRRPKTPHEVTALIARGRIVHPTVPSFAQFFGQPGITYVPIEDMPWVKSDWCGGAVPRTLGFESSSG
jgi:hypothetical protein